MDSIARESLSTVFQTEVMAILMCTELLLSKDVMRRRIHSRAAKPTTKLAPIREFMQVLEKPSVSNKVTLV